MSLFRRPLRAGAIAVMGLAMIALSGAFSSAAIAAAPSSAPRFVAMTNSVPATTDTQTGLYHSSAMSVEVVLAPRHQAQMSAMLQALYTKGSAQYQHWLAKGQFDSKFAPAASTGAAVASYLRASGLGVTASGSPFLVRATGSSQQVSAAFRTTLNTYRDSHGITYYSNSTAVQLPRSLASGVLGVVGLTNTVREHPMVARISNTARPVGAKAAGKSSGGSASCETPYPTTAQLFNLVNNDVGFPYGYGAGPGCSGLTPSQTNSIYDAPQVGPRGKGKDVNVAVFELSAYQESDIATWAHQFYGPNYTPPLQNVLVDGGPLDPQCPTGDTCPPDFNGYAGDIEVDADIEMQLTIAPDVRHLIVYNAPNDFTGQTELDEYTAIANDDRGRRGQLELVGVRERRDRGLCPGREHGLRADGRAGAEHVRRRGRHRRVLLHPLGRHHDRQRPRPALAALGDQRRRHVADELQPRDQAAPGLPPRRRDGVEREQPVQQPGAQRG